MKDMSEEKVYPRTLEESWSRIKSLESRLTAEKDKWHKAGYEDGKREMESRLKEALKEKEIRYGMWLCPNCNQGTASGYLCHKCSQEKILSLEARLSHLMDVAGKLAFAIAPFCDGDPECEYDRIAKLALAEWDGIKEAK